MIHVSGFNSCRDNHDICYGTCGNLKKKCDSIFRDCLFNKCKALESINSDKLYFIESKLCNKLKIFFIYLVDSKILFLISSL